MTTYTGNTLWGPLAGLSLRPQTAATFSMDDADNSIAAVFSVPADVTLAKIGAYVTVTGNPPAYQAAFVTVDTSGNPTTTAYGSCVATEYDFTTTGWHWITLGTAAAGTAGDVIAARLWPSSAGTADASNYVQVRLYNTNGYSDMLPHSVTGISSALPFDPASALSLGVMDSGGTVHLPAISDYTYDYDADSTPDEVGALFSLPFDATCNGAAIAIYPETADSNFTIKLYSGATELASVAMDASQLKAQGGYRVLRVYWDAVEMTMGSSYRLSVLATGTGVNDIVVPVATVNEAASREWFTEGARWQYTARADGGSWTESTTKLPMLGLLLSSYTTDGGSTPGAGSSAHSAGLLVG